MLKLRLSPVGVLLIAFAVVAAWGPAGRLARSAELPAAAASSRPAQLDTATRPAAFPVRVIELRGDPPELGKSHGAQLRDVLRTLLTSYIDRFLEGGSVNRESLLKVVRVFEPLIRPEHLSEIRALAASAGLDPREVLLVQCFPDLTLAGGCSAITLPAAASTDRVARFGRNLDFASLDILDRHAVLFIFHPKERYAFASISFPGMVGVLSGMNEHGLTLANMEVRRPYRALDGMPYMLLYRAVLEHCKTVNEAVAFLEKTPRQSANNLMLMDASGDRAVAEITPDRIRVRRAPDTAALISTNHQRGTNLDSPGRCKRYDSLHDAARRQFGRLSEVAVEEMLADAAQGDFTIQSMVFEPANRVLYLAVGAGAPNHKFVRLDLRPYLRD